LHVVYETYNFVTGKGELAAMALQTTLSLHRIVGF